MGDGAELQAYKMSQRIAELEAQLESQDEDSRLLNDENYAHRNRIAELEAENEKMRCLLNKACEFMQGERVEEWIEWKACYRPQQKAGEP